MPTCHTFNDMCNQHHVRTGICVETLVKNACSVKISRRGPINDPRYFDAGGRSFAFDTLAQRLNLCVISGRQRSSGGYLIQ